MNFFHSLASQNVEDTGGSVRHKNCPVSLHPCARDAYLLFQVSFNFAFCGHMVGGKRA